MGKSLTLRHNVYFLVEAENPRDLAYFLKLLQLCMQFLAFVSGTPIYSKRLVAHSGDAEIHLYRPPSPRGNTEKKLSAVHLPFGLIQSVVPTALKSWIENAEKFGPVYEFAVAAQYSARLNLQVEFLDLAQALEIFHRRRFAKRYHFKQRLQGLLDELSGPTRSQVVGQDCDFVEKVDRTRNYLVHFDESLKGKVLNDSSGYFETNKKLRALLFVVMCKMIGIDEQIAVAHAFGSGEVAVW